MAASSPGLIEATDEAVDQEADISYLTVGFWRRSAKPGPLSFLVMHSKQMFVLLSEEPWKGQQAQSKKLFRLVSQLNAKSPFRTSSCKAGAYMVVAFEIKWEDVLGFSYHNPLCLDGRVVIEAAKLTKRQFLTMKEAQKYYLKRVSTPEPQSPHFGRRGALRTYASSPNMSLPLILRTAHLTSASSEARHSRHQHVQWQAENKQQAHSSATQPAAMRSLDSDMPSMPESSAMPQAAAAAGAQEAPFSPAHHLAPDRPSNTHSPTKTCLKHAGVGKMSPPQAREQAKLAALDQDNASKALVACLQASSVQDALALYNSQQPAISGLDSVFESAFSGASQLPLEEELRRQSASSEHSVSEQWPETCSWTVPCHIFKYRTVTFNFKDPLLPGVLEPAINNNERLLKLYESGLPVWAIFLPTYGLYYRPWMRRLTWTLFIAVSIFSMACGFYDLYKNVPHVDMVLRKVLGSMFLPSTAIFHWLEDHTQIRLSILLTYLFGESILFVHLITWLDRAWNAAGRPIVQVLGPPLISLGSNLGQSGRQLLLFGRSCAAAGGLAVKAMMGPPMSACLAAIKAIAHFMLPLWQVLVFLVKGPAAFVVTAFQSAQLAVSTVWQGAKPLGKLARSASGLVRTTSLVATTSGASVADMGQQVGWWWRWMPAPGEAWELMRISSLKTLRALQTLAKLASQLGSDISKHRLTLSRRLWRLWRRCKRWCCRMASAIVYIPLALYRYLAGLWQKGILSKRPNQASRSPCPEAVNSVLADASERPILNGIVAQEVHDHAE